MAERLSIEDLSRQPLVVGTMCFTDPAGKVGYKTDQVQASALVRIAAALEAQTALLLTSRAGFTAEQQQDGLNHFHGTHVKDTPLIQIDFLATSPAMAQQFLGNITQVLKAAIAAAEQEGGVARA